MIADRKLYGVWSGDIYIDGVPRTDNFRLRTAYVLQDDVHIATLTVKETLYYSAWTRVPALKTHEQIEERVNTLLKMMGIDHVQNSIVGNALTKGISGGQMKRLSIAVELVNLPDVIFLDEPTSGLDSSISLEVMTAVKDIIGKDRLCVSTIHQPSPEVFALFDKLVLLSAGRLVYSADTKDCIAYFTNPHMGYTYIEGENPAEFVIAVGGGKELPKGYAKIRQPDELEMLFKTSKYFQQVNTSNLKKKSLEYEGKDSVPEMTDIRTQFRMLMTRSWVAKARDYPDLKAQLFKNVVVGLLIGIVFYGQGDASEPFYTNGVQSADVNSVNSILFFTMMFTMVGNLQAIPYLCSQILVYRRELASHAYYPGPFWFSQLFCTMPIQFFFHFIFVIFMYFLVGLSSDADYFFYYLFLTFFMNLVAFYSSIWLASATNSEPLAFSIFPITFLFVVNFSGYSITIDSLPPLWSWAAWVSYARWGFEGLMVNQWDRFDTDDATDDASKDGNGDILDSYDFTGYDKANTFWILFFYMVAFALMTLYALMPAVKKLEKVPVGEVTDTAVQSHAITAQRKSLVPWGDTVTDWKESLLGGKTDKEEETEVLTYEPRKNTEFFRVSTGTAPSAQGCHVTFKDVNYTVTDKFDSTKKSQLLINVSGQVFPGEMCALMGASGAGKSTLLDVLAGRKNTGQISGEMLYNNSPKLTSAAYVMQDSVHIGLLTVRQSIYFAAELRLPEDWSREKKDKRINKVLDMLGLQEVANTQVGTEDVRGISGGQLKRLSIGVEIVNLPDVIFLDEPTTGLDSSIAFEVMSAVRNLANQNRTVICTIHQPSKLTFELFDKVLILAKGRVCYFGGNKKDNRNEAVDYFANSPWQFYYKPNSNPADFVIAVAGSHVPAADGSYISADKLSDYYDQRAKQGNVNSTPFRIDPNRDALSTSIVPQKPASAAAVNDDSNVDFSDVKYNTSTWHQVKTLTYRTAVKLSRDQKATVVATIRYHTLLF
jgi:ABC-type multidrug transport system ATPase subunit